MATIGIAGYMGSGKSALSAILARQGAIVVDADTVAKELMNGDAGIRRRLAAAFGNEVIEGGKVLFTVLGCKAFQSCEKMATLNKIVHPLLLEELGRRIRREGETVRVLDAALISLWKIESWFDVVCWVDADFDRRFDRLTHKLKVPAEELFRRMRLQEQVVERPVGGQWKHVGNNATMQDLERVCRDIIKGCTQ